MWLNQWTVATNQSGSVSLKALAASIAVHVIVLGTFGVARFSDRETSKNEDAVVSAGVSRINEISQKPRISPKPKIRHRDVTDAGKRGEKLWSSTELLEYSKPENPDSRQSEIIESSQGQPKIANQDSLQAEIKFFGSVSRHRKVCYVVDCSGSMRGMFARVRRELTESIDKLWADQYFYIIFFGNGKIQETGGGRLIRATENAKRQAYSLIESVKVGGKTNAPAALKRAMQIRDEQHHSASVVYFLTDGFELTGEAGREFLRQTLKTKKQFAPLTRINTIGFWPQNSDRILLEKLSRQSGGKSVFVGDPDI